MMTRLNEKHTVICLLLCALFLTSYTGFLNANGTILSDINIFNGSSINGPDNNSSLGSGGNPWQADYITMAGSPAASYFLALRSSAWPETKTDIELLASLIEALIICLILSSQLTYTNSNHYNSIQITAFLHKKDGMK